MNITVHWVTKDYADVKIEHDGHTLTVGYMTDEKEREELAKEFQQAAIELTDE